MKESFINYLWKHQIYSNKELKTTDGLLVTVISAGIQNPDSGPDFFNAKIKIGDTVWAGNVEIHVRASDWIKHQHQFDQAYQNVILHVVAVNDHPIKNRQGEYIPTVELQSAPGVYEQFLFLMQNKDWVPCESFVSKVDDFTWMHWKDTLLVERLHQKSLIISERFELNAHHWEETFYQTLANNFGFKTNAQPFEKLARYLPQNLLAKHKDDLKMVEALIFGQSGLLPTHSRDSYVNELIQNFHHLSLKFDLKPMDGSLWKFSKLRPINFPTIRLAQFSALIHQSFSLMSKMMEAETIQDMEKHFQIKASEYWDTHYVFEKESSLSEKHFGTDSFYNLVINTMVPFLFFYAKKHKQPQWSEKAMQWLQQIPSEQNQIIKHWQRIGIGSQHAFDSQALLQLKNKYCIQRQCLNCRIGNQVIQHRF